MPTKRTSKVRRDRVGKLVAEVESVAKKLRTDILKRAEATGSEMQKAANLLRKRAAAVAAQVEKQVHQLRKDLEKSAKAKKGTRKRAASKR
jgi:hypothetical protein